MTTVGDVRRRGTTEGVVPMEGVDVDAVLDQLEDSSGLSEDAPRAGRDLSALLAQVPSTEAQRARSTILGMDDLVRDHGAAHGATVLVAIRQQAEARGDRSSRLRAELELATELATPWKALHVLNNWAYAELLAGHPAAASDLAERLQALAAEHRVHLKAAETGTVGEILHARGRTHEAITMLRQSVRAGLSGTTFEVADCTLALARIERESGDLDAAEATLGTAERLATTHEHHGLHVATIGERAELLAARGDHAGAYETHLRFHEQTLELSSAAADARARTLHAMLEVDTARRESARYRQLSYRDPLTGLLNRRHVDEDLDHRLSRGADVAVALVDLDHFKAVNDTCSHEAGDHVLVRLAGMLEEAAAAIPDAYAARLGGEEFLLVLPDHDLPTAHAVADTLRQHIATHDWTDLAPGAPVTASIGIATTTRHSQPPPTRAGLLHRADRHLYAAKDNGRDRVEPGTARELPDSLEDVASGDDDDR